MRVFLTGATGFIGSRIVPELLAAGHQVIGLTRSEQGAQALRAAGAEVHLGTLEDPASLRAGAEKADAVIHTAFDHNFANFVANCEKDRQAIEAMGSALIGSDRPFIITSGTGLGDAGDGQPATEAVFNPEHPNPRALSEVTGQRLLDAGVDVRVMRLPQVHDRVKQGLITPYIALCAEKGVAAWVGDGTQCWSAAHVSDVANLFVRVLDKGVKGARYHAVAEEAIAARDITELVGHKLGIPTVSLTAEQSPAHFGWFAMFASMDLRASGAWTRQQLDWQPTGPGLMDDLEKMDYASFTR